MLKMYQRGAHDGSSAEFWEEAWDDGGFEEALRFCEVDPLRKLFERYARPGSTMLEGGCGRGQYVAFYSDRGINVTGLDFASEALVRLQRVRQNLRLCAGDVSNLPFGESSFDVYYSGGVVEHFEEGPQASLAEAHRVLREDGVLLVSVPYLSPLRRAVSMVKRSDRRTVNGAEVDESVEDGSRFFQYAYTRREFRSILNESGFEVRGTLGYSILWGLSELPFVDQVLNRRLTGSSKSASHAGDSNAHSDGVVSNGSPARQTLIKRLLIGEDSSVPVAGLAVKAMRWACANMMMYVCSKRVADG